MSEDATVLSGDGDWSYYVEGHNPENLWEVDDPNVLLYGPIWMRPIRSKHCYEDGWHCDCDPQTFSLRGKDGKFKARFCRIECLESHPDAEPWMGCRYKPRVEAEA